MKVYLVRSIHEPNFGEAIVNVYGVFTTEEKAEQIVKDLKVSNEEWHETGTEYTIDELELDRPTEDFYYMTEVK